MQNTPNRLAFPVFIFLLFFLTPATASSAQFGDPAKLAVRFDETTGNISQIVYQNEVVTVPGAALQRFDIRQDENWVFGLAGGKLELVGMAGESKSVFNVTQKLGDWTVTFRYVLGPQASSLHKTLSWNAELVYNGKEPTKIKSFWMSYPLFPFGEDAEFIVPGLFPPKVFKPENFAVGAKQGLWRSGSPLVFQLDKNKSVLLFSDQLINYADRPGGDVTRYENGIRLVQSFDTKGHVKPGLLGKQFVGVGALRIVDGDAEKSLLKYHDLLRDFGHVVPADRPQWFTEAIAYSMHPGGTTGSMCRDLGGFVPTLDTLPRIKELGCNVIWFMPLEDQSIYWPRDYYKLQSGLGSTDEKAPQEYQAVVRKAHEIGLRVVQDSVPHGGSNTNQRAKDHPYWLAQNEDGSTLDYWCFDFNWPSWINYMAEVSRFYVKTYDIDGFRIDACGGSKIPNWNPKIPYARASLSQSQGGLNMVRAIRKALKDEKPDGATLAEVNGSLFGAVSDAVYDFDLCYNILHDIRKLPTEEFVSRLRRWLHEQQYSEIPDLLRLRHVESHDSLRAQLWYGTQTHRKLVALTAFIHGIPLVYHDEEIGHDLEFKRIFETRKALPELNGGDADYLCVNAPPGIFACLRGTTDQASVVLIDFTDNDKKGTVSVPWGALPKGLRDRDVIYCLPFGSDEKIWQIRKTGDHIRFGFIGNGTDTIYVLRSSEDAFDEMARWKEPEPMESPTLKPHSPKLADMAQWDAKYIRLDSQSETLFIDPKTGLPACCVMDGVAVLGEADLLLPVELKNVAENPVIEKSNKKISVKQKFGDATLEINYLSEQYRLNIETRWTGKNVPKSSALSLPVFQPYFWTVDDFTYHHVPHRRVPEGFFGSIYWRPQGSDLFYDSVLNPLGDGQFNNTSLLSFLPQGSGIVSSDLERRLACMIGFGEKTPIRLRLQGPMGESNDIHLILSWTDEETPQLDEQPAFTLQIARSITGGGPGQPRRFYEVPGGWIFENDYYKLRLTRNGQIMALHTKEKDGSLKPIINQGDIYTDYGYGSKEIRYAASNDVESGIRIVQDADGTLRLRFEGQLRGFNRFELLKPPVEFFTEYALNNGPEFGFSCGVKTSRLPSDSKGFLALMLPMPQVDAFEYLKNDQKIADGSSADAKGRSFECKADQPDRVLLRTGSNPLMEIRDIRSDGTNLFLDRKNFFVTFDDENLIGEPNRWRTWTAGVSPAPGAAGILPARCRLEACGPRENTVTTNNLLLDGDFENAVGHADLVALRSGAVLKGLRKTNASWSAPHGGSLVRDEFRLAGETPAFHNGTTSARVDGIEGQYLLWNQSVSPQKLEPGQRLRLSAWVKGKDLKPGPISWQVACVRLAYTVEGNSQTQYVSTPALSGTFDWKEVSVDWTVPEKLTGLSVQLGNNGGTGTVWIDEVRME